MSRLIKSLPKWATLDPYTVSASNTHTIKNILDGKVVSFDQKQTVVDPVNGQNFMNLSLVEGNNIDGFVKSQKSVPAWGLHNPIKNVARYNMYGDIFLRMASEMRNPDVENFFTKLTQRVMPKSWAQCLGQYVVTRRFFENFTGDNPRFFQRSFNVAGDHDGQTSSGYRWPFGNVCVITPFNFPIEIAALQLFGALLTGNRPLLKCDNRMSVVMEQFLYFAHSCGLPAQDVNFINCSNQSMENVIDKSDFKVIQFTGSSKVSEHLAKKTNGKVRVEDAGFDWKILGPDVQNVDYVTYVSDQDAYGASGQKCSAQSVLFVHENWMKVDFIDKIKKLSERRKFDDLSIGPVISWDNARIKSHIDAVSSLKGAEIAFGGKPLSRDINKVPSVYGLYEPTAVKVPIQTFMNNFELCSTELFGPFQVIVPYKDSQINKVIECCNRFNNHLTAGVVSNDVLFLEKVLGETLNGVTYAGNRARTTGAPQNHWFGPAGDPRGAGIGTKQAILTVWTTHREIIRDYGPVDSNWTLPPPT